MENIEDMKKAIRYNGLLLEQLQDHILHIHEGHELMCDGLKDLKESLQINQLDLIPSLAQAIKSLSNRIVKIETFINQKK